MADPADRRHRYPFTNCTACGPRFTIALGAPYDRPATTMAAFRMCPACAREYGDPLDRRFHAQPNACPACGPRVEARDPSGAPIACADPVAHVAAALASGAVAAVKGIGGYHLACDATSPAAVRLLRARKRREEKPLAVMVADLEAAGRLADLAPEEAALLASPERPIVLCRRLPDAPLAPELAPGSPLIGLLLAYAPLHHLLLAAAGRPLVMTSANLSDEPIAFEDQEALARLSAVADVFLVHDRPIASRCDDSVARVVAGRPLVMRRARGYVPRPVRVAPGFARPVLAVGAQLKNACCLARGDEATLGPHVGDLDGLEAYAAFEQAVARLEAFLALRPELLACDLHPLYLSTRYARERAAQLGVPVIAVQHHHAHAAAAMAEHGLEGPALALCWDGTGLGTDGAAWGGELLLVERGRFERLATLRPVPLAGGDQAIRHPWRIALAALLDAFGEEAPLERLPLLAAVDPGELAVVRRMLATGLNAPLAHGVGRAFDAAGALALGRASARFEGQVALALDAAAGDASGAAPYPFDVTPGTVEQLDLRPLWRALTADVLEGTAPAEISARFHAALAAGGAALVRRAARRTGGAAGGAHRRLLPERPADRGDPGGALGRVRGIPARPGAPRRRRDRARTGGRRRRPGPGLTAGRGEARHVSRGSRQGGRHRRARRHGGLLRRQEAPPPRHRRRAGLGGRLRAEPRGLRHPAHPARGGRGDPGALRPDPRRHRREGRPDGRRRAGRARRGEGRAGGPLTMAGEDLFHQLKFRDPVRARALAEALGRNVEAVGREVKVMHVCGSHEQAIARFGLRAVLPPGLELIMGPGCPVCVTDGPEVDEAVALASQGVRVCTYGDMLRLPGTARSLADAQADGARVEVVYSVAQAVELAARHPGDEVVFFASGFETTAVATAAVALAVAAARTSRSCRCTSTCRRRWRSWPPRSGRASRGTSRPATPPSSPAGRSSSPSRGRPARRWWWPGSSRSTSWPRW